MSSFFKSRNSIPNNLNKQQNEKIVKKPKVKTAKELEEELHAMFCLFDKDKDGLIDSHEFRGVCAITGYKIMEEELHEISKEVDETYNGKIDIKVFMRLVNQLIHHEVVAKDQLEEAFKIFDQDGDGLISKDELRQVLRAFIKNPTEEHLHHMMEDGDLNGDGFIDYDEFVHAIMK